MRNHIDLGGAIDTELPGYNFVTGVIVQSIPYHESSTIEEAEAKYKNSPNYTIAYPPQEEIFAARTGDPAPLIKIIKHRDLVWQEFKAWIDRLIAK